MNMAFITPKMDDPDQSTHFFVQSPRTRVLNGDICVWNTMRPARWTGSWGVVARRVGCLTRESGWFEGVCSIVPQGCVSAASSRRCLRPPLVVSGS
jgi:hypothetical protein